MVRSSQTVNSLFYSWHTDKGTIKRIMVVQETIFLKEYKNYTFYIYTEEKIGSSKHGATTIEEQQQ